MKTNITGLHLLNGRVYNMSDAFHLIFSDITRIHPAYITDIYAKILKADDKWIAENILSTEQATIFRKFDGPLRLFIMVKNDEGLYTPYLSHKRMYGEINFVFVADLKVHGLTVPEDLARVSAVEMFSLRLGWTMMSLQIKWALSH